MLDRYMGHEQELVPLQAENYEWKDSSGRNIQLCAFHEMDPNAQIRAQSVTVVYGFALCRDHLQSLMAARQSGKAMSDIIDIQFFKEMDLNPAAVKFEGPPGGSFEQTTPKEQ